MITVQPYDSERTTAGGAVMGPPRDITYLRISVTDRCNLRCSYCMPRDQTFYDKSLLLSFEEIVSVARVLVDRGVSKIRLTGGEPLMRRHLPLLVAMLKALPGEPKVVMTTNASLLSEHARALRDAGLDRINISLDTLRPDRFEQLSHRPGLPQVLKGIDVAHEAGFQGTKLNMVVMGGINDDELPDMLRYAGERDIELRFLEFMPMESNQYGLQATRIDRDGIRQRLAGCGELLPLPRGHSPAEPYVLSTTGQRVGIIAAISLPFCDTCNRVRLTATGVLRSCLFEGGEVSLRDALRGNSAQRVVGEALEFVRRVKPDFHEGLGHVQMNRVGG
jgi:cyclic pyranopterin phosphate synthase